MPEPKDDATKRRLQKQKRRDTGPELALRRELHARGFRYRVDWRPPIAGFRSRLDLAFTKQRIAVFVDGCFWHGCPEHSTVPKHNRQWWIDKIDSNRERDTRNEELLARNGWTVIRVWEHEDPVGAADRVVQALSSAG